MSSHTKKEKLLSAIIKIGEQAATSRQFRSRILELLRPALAFCAGCCTAVDPRTLLTIGATTDDEIEQMHHLLFEYEYLHADVNKLAELAAAERPAAALSEHAFRSGRFQNILQPAGWGDELRVALRSGSMCWGFLILLRKEGLPPFQPEDIELASDLSQAIASGLRDLSLSHPELEAETQSVPGLDLEAESGPVSGPESKPEVDPSASIQPNLPQAGGLFLLDESLSIVSYNEQALYWLDALRSWEQLASPLLPRPIRAVAAKALASEGPLPPVAVSLRKPDGGFLTLRAIKQRTASGSRQQVAVSFELAPPSDLLYLVAESYGLTARETEIVAGILRGKSTKELASELYISPYTVQDHLKSIFAKAEVSSRRELGWQLHNRFSSGF